MKTLPTTANGQPCEVSTRHLECAQPGTVNMLSFALQGLFAPPHLPTHKLSRQHRRGNAYGSASIAELHLQTLPPVEHLQRALDSLPQGRTARQKLRAVEFELFRGSALLSNLGQAVLASALAQLSALQHCADDPEQLRPTAERIPSAPKGRQGCA